MPKFNQEARTFETRLQFINSIFSDLHDRSSILTSCIQYKLSKSLDQYIDELRIGTKEVNKINPITVIQRISKE